MRLLPRVPPHVDDEHVLRLEGLLLAAAISPLANERLLAGADVVIVQMLQLQSIKTDAANWKKEKSYTQKLQILTP